MGLLRWLAGGMICGAVGALVWVLIGYYAEYEIGWLAWGIGFIVGVGVRFGAHLGDEEESDMQGLVAAAIACGSIVAAKYIIFVMLTSGMDIAGAKESINAMGYDDEAMTVSLAYELVDVKLEAGETLQWPPGKNYDNAQSQGDFPTKIWKQAEQRWNDMPEAEQQNMVEGQKQLILQLNQILEEASPSFGDFFSPWDILWFGLALVTAYKVGSGSYGGD